MVTEVCTRRVRALRIVWLVVLLSITTATLGAEAQRDDAQTRGRSLYLTGMHADGRPLTAGNESTGLPLPQAFVACVNCHGYEARGKTEGGTVASDIRWDTLTKPYELARSDGRRRAPYDAAAFFSALTEGRDPSGHELDSAMPRFALSTGDADDLLAYLRHLASPGDQGVGDDAIRIGIVSSHDSADRAVAESDRRLLWAWFDEINRNGGIFRRRIELISMVSRHASDTAPVLAILAITEHEAPTQDADASAGTPLISVVADALAKEDRYRFSLFPGIVERARVLARYAIARAPSSQSPLTLLYPESTTSPALLASVIAALKPFAAVNSIPITSARAAAAVDALRAKGVDNVLMFGMGASVEALVANARRREWAPLFLWIERPRNGEEGVRAVTIEPALITDVTAEAGARYARCVDLAATNERDRARQLALLATAQLLVTALEQGGRDISRERLVETLEALREFRSGFAPPGSLTPQRHTAASGVYVVPLPASRFQPDPVWMMLD